MALEARPGPLTHTHTPQTLDTPFIPRTLPPRSLPVAFLHPPHPPHPVYPPPPRGISQAEIVICSLPLGVLKAATCPVFDPPLPPRKLQAVERLGFGTLNKVGGRGR